VLESLIARYGLLAVFAGTFFEGETVLVLAGFAAHRGYLALPAVILAAGLGTLLGDQLWFWAGRLGGARLLAARPAWRQRVERSRGFLARHEAHVIWSFRFLYGLRTVAPFVLGMSGTPPLRFLALNAASAALWAVLVGGAGYLLGAALERLLGRVREVEGYVFGAIALAGLGVWAWHFVRTRREMRPGA
jgi:membrane protein DedA with SNARE-associated domain